jgi:RNA binding exosome subunit
MSGKPEMDENHFSGADISCVLHATEDENNVLKSASETFSISKDRFFFKRLEGHWGNPIIYLIAFLDSKEAWTTALKIMISLNPLERNQLKESLHDLVDEKGNMYIRLDKQGMCRGKINLSEFDSVRIKFRPVKTFRKISNVPDYKVILSLDE